MSRKKTIEEKYQKLEHVDHVLLRPARHIGTVEDRQTESWTVTNEGMKLKTLMCSPGFLKLFDEIILNSVDEADREGSSLDTIKTVIDRKKGILSVEDNGGIPVVMHKEHKEYVPEMLFGHLMAGSNFDDTEDRTAAGTHGEGASLVNIFSSKFTVETDDGKRHFKMEWKDNSKTKGKPQISASKKNGTKITWIPDSKYFKFSADDEIRLIKRVYDIAGCRPDLKIWLNGRQIKIKSFKDYVKLYTETFIYEENDEWQIAVAPSDSGAFSHVSFVNSIETFEGGTHTDYITNQIVNKIREWIFKKKKYDIKPGEIKNHVRLFLNCTVINPQFSSQTKERLVTDQKKFKTDIQLSDKFINAVIKSEIIQSILDWIEAKEKQKELQELKKLNKTIDKNSPRRITKLNDASEKTDRDKCLLCITEGLSASMAVVSARDPRYIGSYALKGKILNVTDASHEDLNNKEFTELMTAIGLKIGEKVKSPDQLRYGKIAFLTDADCLHEDTEILTNEGKKKLRDINPGDSVLSSSGNYNKVLQMIEKKSDEYYVLRFDNDYEITALKDHPFYVYDNIQARTVIKKISDVNIQSDSFIGRTETGKTIYFENKVLSLLKIKSEEKTFIDIEVENDHNFYSVTADGELLLQKNCDGAHISGLLCNMFYRFWPEMFELGMIHRFITPVIKAVHGKEETDFYSVHEFEKWEKQNKKPFKAKWLKGLASSTSEDFRKYLKNLDKNLIRLEYKDKKDFEVIELFFDKDKAEERKEYLKLEEK